MPVKLRAVEPLDADFMYAVENDPAAWKYNDTVAPLSRAILRDYAASYDADPFRAGQIRFIVCDSGSSQPVGIADLFDISPRNRRAFTGIYILPEFRGSGLATWALHQLAHYARSSLALHQVAAHVTASNTASIRLFERSGFSRCALLPQWSAAPGGNFTDIILFNKLL